MAQAPKATVLDHFAELDDPRVERARRHDLVDILTIAICATICGADSWVHIELFGKSKLAWWFRLNKDDGYDSFAADITEPGSTLQPTASDILEHRDPPGPRPVAVAQGE